MLSATTPSEMTPCFMRILVKEEELTMEGIRQFYIAVEWKLDMSVTFMRPLASSMYRYLL